MDPGRLTHRLAFHERAQIDDGAGNRRGAWVLRLTVGAELRANPRSEVFAAARMEGRVPFAARIRRSTAALAIAQGWMAVGRDGTRYRVVAPAPDPVDRAWLSLTLIADGTLDGQDIAAPPPPPPPVPDPDPDPEPEPEP